VTEPERRAAELRTLLAWLSHQQAIIQRVGDRLDRAIANAADGRNPDAVAAAALHLQHYSPAVEDALVRIGERLDGTVPSGEDWHRLLLDQMRLDIPGIRSALLTTELRDPLDVLRRFHHRVRHAYGEELAWPRMAEPLRARSKADELMPAFVTRCRDEIGAIIQALETPR
jgi:hypothetical protein